MPKKAQSNPDGTRFGSQNKTKPEIWQTGQDFRGGLHKRSRSHKVPIMIITTFNQPGKYEMSEPILLRPSFARASAIQLPSLKT